MTDNDIRVSVEKVVWLTGADNLIDIDVHAAVV